MLVSDSSGRYAPMIISTEKNTGRSTSRAAASTILLTFCRERSRSAAPRRWAMFSAMITAPSTMMPKSIAPTESRPMGMPVTYINTSATSRAKGMVRATSAAIEGRPRNNSSTSTTSVIPITTLWPTVCSVLSTRNVRS